MINELSDKAIENTPQHKTQPAAQHAQANNPANAPSLISVSWAAGAAVAVVVFVVVVASMGDR
jgi:hypothetical protein